MHISRIYFLSLRSGLEFATATDGTSEWVRPEDVERFKKDGSALLGKDTKVSDAEKGAHKTALMQFQAMRQQQEQISDEVSTGKDQAPTGAVVQKPEAEADDVAFDNAGAAKGLNDNAHGIDRFGYRVR